MNTYKELYKYCQANDVQLVAVSKTRPNDAILNLYEQGQRVFGENRVQELVEKYKSLPTDIGWHMIGHLQSNKVKQIAPFVSMIHSGEKNSLLKEINKEANSNNRTIDVLLQIKIATEDSKYGWKPTELYETMNANLLSDYTNINIRGVMGMATFTDNKDQVRKEFDTLKSVFDKLKDEFYSDKKDFDVISMGMSGDYKLAIESGSNMVRIGSLLFGGR